jgi:hypothetical protein
MKITILAAFTALLVMGSMIASVEEAGAMVCARGVYRAGCVGPHGAAVVHRGYYGGGVHRAVYRGGVHRRW